MRAGSSIAGVSSEVLCVVMTVPVRQLLDAVSTSTTPGHLLCRPVTACQPAPGGTALSVAVGDVRFELRSRSKSKIEEGLRPAVRPGQTRCETSLTRGAL